MRFLVVGDAMVDRYYTAVRRPTNPEGSFPLLTASSFQDYFGGAANVWANLRAMGVSADLVSGEGLVRKNRFVVDGEIVYRFDEDGTLAPIKGIPLGNYNAVLVSDYGKGSIDSLVEAELINFNVPLFIDTKKPRHAWNCVEATFFPNVSEYEAACPFWPIDTVIHKRGELGVVINPHGGRPLTQATVSAVKVDVKNVTGAGDTVMAAYAVAYTLFRQTWPYERSTCNAAKVAVAFASAAIGESKTYAPTFVSVMSNPHLPTDTRNLVEFLQEAVRRG